MPEKFLILGASSFYGRNFAEYVRAKGHDAICWSRPVFDIARKGDCWLFDRQDYADYIINFVSSSLVAESWADPVEWMHINASMTTNMFESLRHLQMKKFVHVSTPESYGSTDAWVDETYTDWKPSTPYAVSRAAADMMLMAYYRAYGFPAIITRTANIYGPGQGANRIIPLAFDTLRRGEKLLLHGGGHTVRSFIHVQDACAATYKVCREGSVGLTYHISGLSALSIADLVRMIGGQLRKRYEDCVGTQPDRLGKDHAYLLDSKRLRNMGWRDDIQLERGLHEYAGT